LQVKNKLHWIIIKWLTMFFKTRWLRNVLEF
jgi:hypothetical protein